MKIISKHLLTKTVSIFFAACLFLSCGDGSSNDEKKTESSESGENLLKGANFYFWNDDSKGSYDASTGKLTLKNGNGGNGAGFSLSADASSYKYAKLSYENLDLPNINFRLVYSDGSYSEVYLDKNSTAAYIELDKDKKSNVTGINFMTRQSDKQTGAETVSLTIKGLSFVKEKPSVSKNPVTDGGNKTFDDSITALELSDKIALGFSLGCGLNRAPFYNDAKGRKSGYGFQNNYDKNNEPLKMNLSEQKTALGNQAGGMALELDDNPLVTKEFIHAIKEKGFASIRICVTWYPHIIDEKYTVDPQFMERVKEVVDWSLEEGLYVLLNEHHSVHAYCTNPGYACGYNLTEEAKPESKRYLEAIYKQICEAFNGSYDERLIFEILNEPRVIRKKDSSDSNWDLWARNLQDERFGDELLSEPTKILNEYNQLIVDTIRASGGNNAKRFIMIPTYATDWSTIDQKDFKIPDDISANSNNSKMMVAIHWYPLGFNSLEKQRDSYSETKKADFEKVFKVAYERFISKGIPVTITEFGIENNDCYGTFKERIKWFKTAESDRTERKECLSAFLEIAAKYGLSAMAWDDGGVHAVVRRFAPYDSYDGDDFINAMISSWKKGRENSYSDGTGGNTSDEFEGKTLKQVFDGRTNAKTITTTGDTSLDASDWKKTCEISASELSGISASSILKLSLSKISGSSYYTIRVCPKSSEISLDMASTNFYAASGAELVVSGGNTSDGKGKNISLTSDSAEAYYRFTSDDVTKITSAGGITIFGYGVKIKKAELKN